MRPRIDINEVKAAARSVSALEMLFHLKEGCHSASLAVSGSNGVASISLNTNEVQCVLGMLIERHEDFLIGLDVEVPNGPVTS